MHIDRAAFLNLALAACGPAERSADAPSAGILPPLVVDTSLPDASAAAVATVAPPPAPLPGPVASPPAAACDLSPAHLDCTRLSPTCQGMKDECNTLAERSRGFTPRVAEVIADCWTKNLKGRACRGSAMMKCIRDAVTSACVEPEAEKACEQILATCQQKKIRPKYDLALCTKMVSSVIGQDRVDVIERLGPTGEGCSNEYALPYYPFKATHR
jgi:hypothetical protein